MHTYFITVDTKGSAINALEGVLSVPSGTKITTIETGRSTITLWVVAPHVKSDGSVEFAGTVPGGFEGVKQVFAITTDRELSAADMRFSAVTALANDGKATPVEVTLAGTPGQASAADVIAPEAFTPTVAASPDVFGGAPFIVFGTSDKQSGVDHYEISSGYFGPGSWKQAESPYMLTGGEQHQKVFVKAVDAAGNSRIESANGPTYALRIGLWAILILLAVCVLSFLLRRRSVRL